MKEKFVDWYKKINLNVQHEQLSLRWQAILAYCKEDDIDILELTKLFFRLPVDETKKKQFTDFYMDKDMALSVDNDLEISVLAGTTLMKLLEENYEESTIILAILCIYQFKPDVSIPDIITIVVDKLYEITSGIRAQDESEQMIEFISIDQANQALSEIEGGGVNQQNVSNLAKALIKNITILQNNILKLNKSLNINRENSKILAWLFGKYSNDLNVPLNKQVDQKNVSLVIGKELADLVIEAPGPYAARSFLDTMLGLCKIDRKNYSLVEIVDTLDNEWKSKLTAKYKISGNSENTPLLLAILKSLESDEPDVWKYPYKKITGVDADKINLDMLNWSYQIYLECLLTNNIRMRDNYGEQSFNSR